MPESDGFLGVLALDFEFGEVIIDRVVEFEFTLFHLLQQGICGHGFISRADQVNGAGSSGGAGPEIGETVGVGPNDAVPGQQGYGSRGDFAFQHHFFDFRLQFGDQAVEVVGLSEEVWGER